MRKVKVVMLVAALLAVTVSTTGTSNAGTDGSTAKPTASVLFGEGAGVPDCPSGFVCLYASANFEGFRVAWQAGIYDSNFTHIFCSTQADCRTNNDFNDEASSWHNNTNMNYCVSWGINGGNPDNTMPTHTSGNFTSNWNDQASSLGFINCP